MTHRWDSPASLPGHSRTAGHSVWKQMGVFLNLQTDNKNTCCPFNTSVTCQSPFGYFSHRNSKRKWRISWFLCVMRQVSSSALTFRALLVRGKWGGLGATSPQRGGWWLQCCWAASGSPIRKVNCRIRPCTYRDTEYNDIHSGDQKGEALHWVVIFSFPFLFFLISTDLEVCVLQCVI